MSDLRRYANYWIAAALCAFGTVAAALGNERELYWLMVSDANVALWLFVAALLDTRR